MHALAVIMSPWTKLAFPNASLDGVLASVHPRLITFHIGRKSRNAHVTGDVRRKRRRIWISVSGGRDQCGSAGVKRNAALEPIGVEAPSVASSNRYTR